MGYPSSYTTTTMLSGCPVGTVSSFTTSPTCNDAEQGTLAVNCIPPAGSTFPAGTTTVTCSCSTNLGSSDVCTFNVFVATANTAPMLSGCPVGTVNSFTTSPTCNDAEQGTLAVNCNPPAGSTFQAGGTTVLCFCSDNLGLSDVCTFSVVAPANTAPMLSGCPVDTVNSFTTSPTCNDAEQGTLAVNCNPPAGSTFQSGTSTVVCFCSDNLGLSDVCTFSVFVATANTAPMLSGCPADTVNSFTTSPTCNDAEQGALAVNCNPQAGSTFQSGTTSVTCSCSDNLGLSDVCTFSVFVVEPRQLVKDISNSKHCTYAFWLSSGTVNSFTTSPTCNDAEQGALAVNCNPPAGSTFQSGTTSVTCSCSDNLGLSDVCTFSVFVATANTAPILSGCPVDTVNSFTTSPTCNDAEQGTLAVNCNPPAGSTFQSGTTNVVCFCSDNLGLSDVCTFSVFVATANTAPMLSGCPAGTVNSFTTSPTCNDAEQGALAVNCNPPAGSTFQSGTTSVTCSCSDNLGLSDVCTFSVFVATANTAPILSGCPVDTVNSFTTSPTCNDAEQATANTAPMLSGCPVDTVNSFTTSPTCIDAEQGALAVNCNPPAGSTFQSGTTSVTCSCSDNLGYQMSVPSVCL
ncbi:putative hyalin [Apostichopus japonicus]|uniref:Putative hyalin n=1 Tax=Stichopus japonicus TaxID=307972 RepID=A0A2G8JW69_STIJA|nr:putative hyalin [Apostichopus japonicus]